MCARACECTCVTCARVCRSVDVTRVRVCMRSCVCARKFYIQNRKLPDHVQKEHNPKSYAHFDEYVVYNRYQVFCTFVDV